MKTVKKILILLLGVASIAWAAELPLVNPGFQEKDGVLIGWKRCNRPADGGMLSTVPYEGKEGFRALWLESAEVANWFGCEQAGIPVASLPKPEAGKSYRFTLEYRQKNEAVIDGAFVTFCFFSKDGKIVGYRDSAKANGTFGWTDMSRSCTFPKIPDNAMYFGIRFFLGKTSGKVWYAEPRLYVDLVEQ
ncbi:hypothetical protein SDC9_143062 [bioreactor metagenome]|uniref:CBM-cenC domain-containing protein n=1 Tax=bioreactor metagenome TaxID=1076179 RepID=A0A645E2W1_9ZZZZ